MICGLVVGKIYKYEFRIYLQNLSGICKMGITSAYELGLKSFLYEKSSTRKVTFEFNQEEINASRPRIVAEIIFSEVNTLEKVKMKIVKIMEKE